MPKSPEVIVTRIGAILLCLLTQATALPAQGGDARSYRDADDFQENALPVVHETSSPYHADPEQFRQDSASVLRHPLSIAWAYDFGFWSPDHQRDAKDWGSINDQTRTVFLYAGGWPEVDKRSVFFGPVPPEQRKEGDVPFLGITREVPISPLDHERDISIDWTNIDFTAQAHLDWRVTPVPGQQAVICHSRQDVVRLPYLDSKVEHELLAEPRALADVLEYLILNEKFRLEGVGLIGSPSVRIAGERLERLDDSNLEELRLPGGAWMKIPFEEVVWSDQDIGSLDKSDQVTVGTLLTHILAQSPWSRYDLPSADGQRQRSAVYHIIIPPAHANGTDPMKSWTVNRWQERGLSLGERGMSLPSPTAQLR